MTRNFAIATIAVLMILSLLLFVGCTAKQQAKVPTPSPTVAAGETPVDDVAAGISGINNAEDELNTSDLADLDNTLADIENL